MNIQLSEHFTYSKLLKFTLPSMVMMVFTSIYGVVDGVFVSNYVGSESFAAVNLIMPFLMILGAVGFMLGSGGSALVSYTLGTGDSKRANPKLRCKMLNNRFAGDVFPKIRRLADAGIEMNGQIVLCRGVNDKEELERSIRDMATYLPSLRSVSVVPVGLSKYRDGLYPLEPFDAASAAEVIDTIEAWQKKIYPVHGVHFIHASDEWYLLANRPLPEEERYDGYLQLENGVGMLRLLYEEVKAEVETMEMDASLHRVLSLATGRLAAPYMEKLGAMIREKLPNLTLQVYEIRNDFFGERITVSGLITARDLIAQLKGQELGEELLLPCNMLRSGEDVFLDDLTVADVEKALQTKLRIVESDGCDFVRAVSGR